MQNISAKIYISHEGIIASGPLTRQPGSSINRIVLTRAPNGHFVVRKESFAALPEQGMPLPEPTTKHSGCCFPASQFAEAAAEFAKYLTAEAGCYRSLYQDL